MAKKRKRKNLTEAKKVVSGTPDDFTAAAHLLEILGDDFPDLDINNLQDSLHLLEKKPEVKKPRTKAKKKKKPLNKELEELEMIWKSLEEKK